MVITFGDVVSSIAAGGAGLVCECADDPDECDLAVGDAESLVGDAMVQAMAIELPSMLGCWNLYWQVHQVEMQEHIRGQIAEWRQQPAQAPQMQQVPDMSSAEAIPGTPTAFAAGDAASELQYEHDEFDHQYDSVEVVVIDSFCGGYKSRISRVFIDISDAKFVHRIRHTDASKLLETA